LAVELVEDSDFSLHLDSGHVLVGFSVPSCILDALGQCWSYLGEVHLHDALCQGPGCSIGYRKGHQALVYGDLAKESFSIDSNYLDSIT